eukprot:scaffold72574_cov41-Attheya_sp.AAC.2
MSIRQKQEKDSCFGDPTHVAMCSLIGRRYSRWRMCQPIRKNCDTCMAYMEKNHGKLEFWQSFTTNGCNES